MAKIKNNKKSKKNIKKENPLGFGFFVIPLIILIFAFALVLTLTKDKSYIYVSPVLKNYKPLEKTDESSIEDYFIDEMGLFYDEARHYLINDSMEYLYEKTGIRVFLCAFGAGDDGNGNLILPTDKEAEETCKTIYKEVCDEGIDVVLLFVPTKVGFEAWTYSTDEVKSEFGSKFERVLKQYVDYYFHVVGEYDELFYYSYRATADRIMGGLTSPIKLVSENFKICLLTFITLVVFIPCIVIYNSVGNKKDKHKRK